MLPTRIIPQGAHWCPLLEKLAGTIEGSLPVEGNTAGVGSVSTGFQPLGHQLWTSEPFQIPFSHG